MNDIVEQRMTCDKCPAPCCVSGRFGRLCQQHHVEHLEAERIALLSAGLALRIEVDGLKAELKRAKADLYVATHPDDVYLRDYSDGSWELVGDDGIILDWHDGKEVSDD